MSAAGTWELVIDTPMGEQKATVVLAVEGDTLTGTSTSDGVTYDITDGSVSGDDLRWKVNLKKPFPMKLSFSTTVSGDDLSGSVKAGMMGAAKVVGRRA